VVALVRVIKSSQTALLHNSPTLISVRSFCQQMHSLLKHKMLQLTLKISIYMAPTCFGPLGPSSGSIRRNLAEVTDFVEIISKNTSLVLFCAVAICASVCCVCTGCCAAHACRTHTLRYAATLPKNLTSYSFNQ
jgi:predicted protein tyrosine phosphatase